MRMKPFQLLLCTAWLLNGAITCSGDNNEDTVKWACTLNGKSPDYAEQIGCRSDFDAVASKPVSASIPGALSVKTVIDRMDNNALYFQNACQYPIHYDFASTNLSGNGLPVVRNLADFNQTEYSSPNRRFLLGSLNYYEGPEVWTYEIASYDSASSEMIETAFQKIMENTYLGDELRFHPTSDSVGAVAASLPEDIKVISTDTLYEGIDYQPLNLGQSMGQLRFLSEDDLESGNVSFRDIAVLATIPNDIAVVSGIITNEFQTPLSHINVLSQNRGTPNMGQKGAFDDETLRALDGKWVMLTVGPFEYSVKEVTIVEADAWWEEHKPDKVIVPTMDLTVTDLRNIEDVLDIEGKGLDGALDAAIPAFGGKASHFGAFPDMGQDVPFPKAFAIPVFYYRQFMELNGFDARVNEMKADEAFLNDPTVRKEQLDALQDEMKQAPYDEAFEKMVIDKVNAEYPGIRMRFRSSTNCEDLDGFTGAGLYTSRSGDPNDPLYPVMDAIRKVWASVWNFRAFEEREYRSISHDSVAMAILVHRSFPDEEANGVAVTANMFDMLNAEQGFYINVQLGEVSVVIPPSGTTSDQFIYYYHMTGKPIVFMGRSSLVLEGETVITRTQTEALGKALAAVHSYFKGLYGSTPGQFYAMDVEFKFDGEPGEEPALFIKQARPYPGWGLTESSEDGTCE